MDCVCLFVCRQSHQQRRCRIDRAASRASAPWCTRRKHADRPCCLLSPSWWRAQMLGGQQLPLKPREPRQKRRVRRGTAQRKRRRPQNCVLVRPKVVHGLLRAHGAGGRSRTVARSMWNGRSPRICTPERHSGRGRPLCKWDGFRNGSQSSTTAADQTTQWKPVLPR